MAEDQDQSQKTEEPTQRRLDEARRKGQVAISREVNHAFLLGAGALFVATLAPTLTVDLATTLRTFLADPHEFTTQTGDLQVLLSILLTALSAPLLLTALLFVAAAIAGGLVQNGPQFSATPLAPKLERISLLAGAKRLFSVKSLVEFAKSVIKIVIVGTAGVVILWPTARQLLTSSDAPILADLVLLRDLTLRLFMTVVVLMVAIALLDVLYQRFEHRKQLRMSRRDLQDEFKQSEGDPHLKARLKSLRMERARRRMMADVPQSTVVITNPAHFAVALRYEAETMAAPIVTAKGVDHLAQRIREIAKTHDVPVVENPPLARALHAAVEVGDPIPPEHFRAAAEIIALVLRSRASS